ncbi:MAG TPA: DUF87 domain-containing protein [Candidatus Angelobacter sp.]|jgi:hypothetical protein|nr:DUF87 domain-containing protein [Candidatus Angelobacter sp.]
MLARLSSPAVDVPRVDGAYVHRTDGCVASVVESGDVDVTALDAARHGVAVAAFARLCRTLDCPLQIVVQVRRWVDGDDAAVPCASDAPSLAHTLRGASAAYRRRMLERRPAFRRSILFVPSAGSTDDLDRAIRLVLDALRTAGVGGTVLHDSTLRARLGEAMCTRHVVHDGDAPALPPWSRGRTHALAGNAHLRAVVLRRLPGVAVEPGWLAPLLDVRAECDISLHITPVGVGDAMSTLGRRLRTLRADQLVELDRESYGDATLEAGVGSALDLRSRLARNEGRAARISLVAVARGQNIEALDAATEALRTAAAATLAHCELAHLQHLEAAASAWPAGRDLLDATKLVDTTALATCIPWTSSTCDDPGGYALGASTTTGTPIRVAPFDTTHHGNANIAVIAASGQGKSYAIGALVLEAAARGVGSVIIDPEGEYERVVRALGGDYATLAPGCATSLNIFDVGGDQRADTVAAVVELIAVLCGGSLDEVERAHVDAAATAAISTASSQSRIPVLGDCLDSLTTTSPRAALVLRRFCTGPLGELFNRPTSARLDAQVVGVSLRDLAAELVPAATLIVAEWLWSLVRRDRRERHVVFDEVGLLCAHPPLRTLLVQLARRCRKYGASLVVATQNAGDLLATPEGTVVATNPAIVLLGGHRGAETARMEEAYALTTAQRRFLESAGRGDFLLLAGARRLPVHVEVSPLHHALLTGQPMGRAE